MVDQTATPPEKHFKIGLAMSGAISAGAYTAGVFDFLVEALSEWEKVKKDANDEPVPGVPQHQVSIVGMAGASAGAITAAVGIASVARGLKASHPEPPLTKPKTDAIPYHNLPELYLAWVESIDFADQTVTSAENVSRVLPGLLNTTDLDAIKKNNSSKNNKSSSMAIESLLNCDALPDVGKYAIASGRKAEGSPPTWLSGTLHLFLTITNLRGVPYSITFQSGDKKFPYIMSSHGEWAHYCVNNLGTAEFHSTWARAGYHKPVFITDLPLTPGDFMPESDWGEYVTHAITSGAFPIGLSAKSLKQPIEAYDQKIFPLPFSLDVMKSVKADWPEKFRDTKPTELKYAAVDGGALDNDPFQLLRYSLMAEPPHEGPRQATDADRCVIMISPFPERPDFELSDDDAIKLNLLSVVKGLVSTFMQNSRYKPEELLRTSDVNDVSSWRIAPSRWNGADQPYAIASGLAGGFGGFLKKDFRQHDYELGRKNCQRFLAHWFGVDKNNPHIDPVVSLPFQLGKENLVKEVNVPENRVAIIPLYGTAAVPVQVRDWPTVTQKEFRSFTTAVHSRVDALWNALPEFQYRSLANPLWKMWLRDKVAGRAVNSLAAGLLQRSQYQFRDGKSSVNLEESQIEVFSLFMGQSYLSNYVTKGLTLDDIKKYVSGNNRYNGKDEVTIKEELYNILKALCSKGILNKNTRYLQADYWVLNDA